MSENPGRLGILLFADKSDIRQRSVPDFSDYEFGGKSLVERDAMFICDRGTGVQQSSGLVMSEIHRQRMPTSLTVQI